MTLGRDDDERICERAAQQASRQTDRQPSTRTDQSHFLFECDSQEKKNIIIITHSLTTKPASFFFPHPTFHTHTHTSSSCPKSHWIKHLLSTTQSSMMKSMMPPLPPPPPPQIHSLQHSNNSSIPMMIHNW
mmetsp:Transcript_1936/g.6944  ORF Transcript_1936/g.6944 Transcript_1936/m.6944 type:complete len:131 (+) Transcript_1936:1669-2061(+)